MGKYVIETKNLTKQYGTQKSVANLNIHVQKGRIYGLLGRNGAGKTTTMKNNVTMIFPMCIAFSVFVSCGHACYCICRPYTKRTHDRNDRCLCLWLWRHVCLGKCCVGGFCRFYRFCQRKCTS